MITLLQILCKMHQCKNFENWLVLDELVTVETFYVRELAHIARISHGNSVRSSVSPSVHLGVCHDKTR